LNQELLALIFFYLYKFKGSTVPLLGIVPMVLYPSGNSRNLHNWAI